MSLYFTDMEDNFLSVPKAVISRIIRVSLALFTVFGLEISPGSNTGTIFALFQRESIKFVQHLMKFM